MSYFETFLLLTELYNLGLVDAGNYPTLEHNIRYRDANFANLNYISTVTGIYKVTGISNTMLGNYIANPGSITTYGSYNPPTPNLDCYAELYSRTPTNGEIFTAILVVAGGICALVGLGGLFF